MTSAALFTAASRPANPCQNVPVQPISINPQSGYASNMSSPPKNAVWYFHLNNRAGPRRGQTHARKPHRWIQERSATFALKRIVSGFPSSLRNASGGERKPIHFRGVRLIVIATSWMSSLLSSSRSVCRGSHRLMRPFAFSTPPFCQHA